MQWLQEELKRPSDFVARATLSPSPIIPPTMCSAALFFKAFPLTYRETSLSVPLSSQTWRFYREIWAALCGARRWPHRRDGAGRTAATLDELLIWTKREAVGGEYGQERAQNEDSEGLPAVTTGSLVCCIFNAIDGLFHAGARADPTLRFSLTTPTRWESIRWVAPSRPPAVSPDTRTVTVSHFPF